MGLSAWRTHPGRAPKSQIRPPARGQRAQPLVAPDAACSCSRLRLDHFGDRGTRERLDLGVLAGRRGGILLGHTGVRYPR
jgi:hypothetical protein